MKNKHFLLNFLFTVFTVIQGVAQQQPPEDGRRTPPLVPLKTVQITPQRSLENWREKVEETPLKSGSYEMNLQESKFIQKLRKEIEECVNGGSPRRRGPLFEQEKILKPCNSWELRNAVRRAIELFGKKFFTREEKYFVQSQITWKRVKREWRLVLAQKPGEGLWAFEEINGVSDEFKRYFLVETQEAPEKIKLFDTMCKALSYDGVCSFFFSELSKNPQPPALRECEDVENLIIFILRSVLTQESASQEIIDVLKMLLEHLVAIIKPSHKSYFYLMVALQTLVSHIVQVDAETLVVCTHERIRIQPQSNAFSLIHVVLKKMSDDFREEEFFQERRTKEIMSVLCAKTLFCSRIGLIACRESSVCLLQEKEKYELFAHVINELREPLLRCQNDILQRELLEWENIILVDWEHLFAMQYYGGDLAGGHLLFNEQSIVLRPPVGPEVTWSDYVHTLGTQRLVWSPENGLIRRIKINLQEEVDSRICNSFNGVYSAIHTAEIEKQLQSREIQVVENKTKRSTHFPDGMSIKRLLQLLGDAYVQIKPVVGDRFVIEPTGSKLFVSAIADQETFVPIVMCLGRGISDSFYTLTTAYPVLCWIDGRGMSVEVINRLQREDMNGFFRNQFEGEHFDKMCQELKVVLGEDGLMTSFGEFMSDIGFAEYPTKVFGGGSAVMIADDTDCLAALENAFKTQWLL